MSAGVNDEDSGNQPAKSDSRPATRFVDFAGPFLAGVAVGAVLTMAFAATSVDAPGPAACPSVGNTCPDGTLYAGRSPESGGYIFAMPADAPLMMSWDQAVAYASDLETLGHTDWRLPSSGELNVLFENRTAIGGFDDTGVLARWYWSSTERHTDNGYAWDQSFADGERDTDAKNARFSARAVRSGP